MSASTRLGDRTVAAAKVRNPPFVSALGILDGRRSGAPKGLSRASPRMGRGIASLKITSKEVGLPRGDEHARASSTLKRLFTLGVFC